MSYFDTEVRRIWSPIDAPPDSLAGRRDDLDPVTIDNEETFEHFRLHGWMRVRAPFGQAGTGHWSISSGSPGR
jgi:hypothetical protein